MSGRQWSGLALGFVGVALVVRVPSEAAKRWAPCHPRPGGAVRHHRRHPVPEARARASTSAPAPLIQFGADRRGDRLAVAGFETSGSNGRAPSPSPLAWLVLVLSLGAISLLNLLIRSGSAVNVASLST